MPDLDTIAQRVRDRVIDQTSVVITRVTDQIQRAQRELEDRHGFLAMETATSFLTVDGQSANVAYDKKPGFLRTMPAPPIVIDGVGHQVEIDFIVSGTDQVRLSSVIDELGKPRWLRETLDSWLVLPPPSADVAVPGGTSWNIAYFYFERLSTLVNDSDTNWFSDNASDYLELRASQRLMELNRDYEESFITEARAEAEMLRVIRHDKKARLSKTRLLQPTASARGSSFRGRRLR